MQSIPKPPGNQAFSEAVPPPHRPHHSEHCQGYRWHPHRRTFYVDVFIFSFQKNTQQAHRTHELRVTLLRTKPSTVNVKGTLTGICAGPSAPLTRPPSSLVLLPLPRASPTCSQAWALAPPGGRPALCQRPFDSTLKDHLLCEAFPTLTENSSSLFPASFCWNGW